MSDSTSPRRRALVSALTLLAIVILCGVVWLTSGTSDDAADTSSTSTSMTTPATSTPTKATGTKTSGTRTTGTKTTGTTTATQTASANIPQHVLTTLAFIDAGEWPEAANAPGTRGGTTFRNNERKLAVTTASGTRITYREWDVNAKKAGQGRDAERIVTGSDGSAWYTDDHYRSFVQIRGPSR